jgi:hypothetical protein
MSVESSAFLQILTLFEIRTDLMATVPERFASSCEQPFGLAVLPTPVELPNIEINLFWHARYNKDPANRWLRQLMFELYIKRRCLIVGVCACFLMTDSPPTLLGFGDANHMAGMFRQSLRDGGENRSPEDANLRGLAFLLHGHRYWVTANTASQPARSTRYCRMSRSTRKP